MIDVREIYTKVPIDLGRKIPNQIFQTWKSSLFNVEHANLLREFRARNFGISFNFYDDQDINHYMEEYWGQHEIFKVFKNTKVGAAKADIWRYCILFDKGGFYLDIDSLFLFKLIDIPKNFYELVAFEGNLLERELHCSKYRHFEDMINWSLSLEGLLKHPKNIVLNWGMCFSKNHPILENCIEFISKNASFFKGVTQPCMHNAVLHFSGPLVLTFATWKYLILGNNVNQMGVDFNGGGIYKAYVGGVYGNETHYTKLNNQLLYE